MKVLPVINANYDNRMNFKSGVSEGQKVVQKTAPMAKDMFLKIGGTVFAGATTFEVVKNFMADKLGFSKSETDNIKPENNLGYDLMADSMDRGEILFMLDRATGEKMTNEEFETLYSPYTTVQKLVDYVDAHKVQPESETDKQ
ncbi:hypothetical protein J6S88_07625 [bacterium]|nr:hypothetical protein [bacterium]